MSTVKIIHISDIHFDKNEPESQGLILNAFFNDLIQLGIEKNDTIFCILSGDLVNKGLSQKIYEDFYEKFIKRLVCFVPEKNIICVPGNHDLNRGVVENNFEEHEAIRTSDCKEIDFNNLIAKEDGLIKSKFEHYEYFCKNILNKSSFVYSGYPEILKPEITIFCLNSALLSSGGYKGLDDCKQLKIETSKLNEWTRGNLGRLKILVLHHPTNYLSDYYQDELKKMQRNKEIDIIISGHTHDQDLTSGFHAIDGHCIKCSSPQLFSSKEDLNGYAILEFTDNQLSCIRYRQWTARQRKFMSGQDFSGTDDGVVLFENTNEIVQDRIHIALENEFVKSMRSYSKTPKWVDRILSTHSPNTLSKESEEKLDHIDLINLPAYYQIIAAPQFGLTCYARYLAMKAWEIKKEMWLYLDCSAWRLSNVESEIEDAIKDFGTPKSSVKCILLDNWRGRHKDSPKILSKIRQLYPSIIPIIFSNFDDTIILKGIDSEESHDGFKQLYLRELNRRAIRLFVNDFNQVSPIADVNSVTERVCLDLTDLNVHRTPLNCLQLLISFQNNFSDRPINRSKVFSYILELVFNHPGKLFYGEVLDENDCKFIFGYFCEYLLRNNQETFDESEFLKESQKFSDENYSSANLSALLQILKNNQLLVECAGKLRFRFSYWIYYFAAERMKLDSEFAEYMFKDRHSVYYPEIIEFYTGIDGARVDAVDIIVEDLSRLSQRVHSKIGLVDDFNPFDNIKWRLNENKAGLTQEQLEENIRNSKLPEEIKDSIADVNYSSVKPYHQTIHDFLDEYEVQNLIDLSRSASRALRNSLYVPSAKKEELSQEIYKAWKEIVRALFLIAPILAKNGFGGIGGATFQLSDNFPKEYEACLKKIIINMPYNIVNWYKDDIYSDKISKLLQKYLLEHNDPIIRHIIARLICSSRPYGWATMIKQYIESVHKNSYYLGDLYDALTTSYSVQYMTERELGEVEKSIKICWAKHNIGSKALGKDSVAKVPDSVIPHRNVSETE